MESIDPATGKPLPADAIQRILFIGNSIHVYQVPPLTSTKGYMAASWTEDPKRQIFTCRMRVIETATTLPGGDDQVKVDLVLEDPSSGQLFAAAPYTSAAVVEPCVDSSRFFAVRVQNEAGQKATLGIGFEERPEAFDFSVSLQEVRKSLGIDKTGGPGGPGQGGPSKEAEKPEEKRDYSLKEGETITVNLGGKFGRRNKPDGGSSQAAAQPASLSGFSLPPPPGSGGSFLPPPPSAHNVKVQRQSAKDLGFDDGQNDEFA